MQKIYEYTVLCGLGLPIIILYGAILKIFIVYRLDEIRSKAFSNFFVSMVIILLVFIVTILGIFLIINFIQEVILND